MTDPRVEKMAQVLVHYSLAIKPGDLFRIIAPPAAAPLVRALYKEALLAGAHPYLALILEETEGIALPAWLRSADPVRFAHHAAGD
jgi:aminopeptidase